MQDIKKAIEHIKSHQSYPATKEELVKECQNLSEFSDSDKKWFMENLPEKTYENADQVIEALGINEKSMDQNQMDSTQGQM